MTRICGRGLEALGRSRGGLSTKIHLAADRRCRPVSQILSPGQHGDCPRFIPLMEAVRIARRGKGRPRTRPGAALFAVSAGRHSRRTAVAGMPGQ
jgi:hypothetical protein